MDISVIIPLYNEEESIVELFEWIKKVGLNVLIKYVFNSGQKKTGKEKKQEAEHINMCITYIFFEKIISKFSSKKIGQNRN